MEGTSSLRNLTFSILLLLINCILTHSQSSVSTTLSKATSKLASEGLKTSLNEEPFENYVISPLSVALGLGMALEGTFGNTRKEVRRALGLGNNLNIKDWKEAIRGESFQNSDTLSVTNLVTIYEEASIPGRFVQAINETFNGQSFRHPFSQEPESAIGHINRFVSTRTNGKIPSLMPEGSVSTQTRIVLVNVVYFKDNWLKTFELNSFNSEGLFKTAKGELKRVEMMTGEQNIGFEEDNEAQIISIPFESDEGFYMVIVSPKGRFTLEDVMESSTNFIDRISDPSKLEFPFMQAKVTMPKFANKEDVKLKKLVSKTFNGIDSIFDARADFRGLDLKNGRDLFVDEIYHSAVIEVDEKGVEAAGATGVSINLLSAFLEEKNIVLDKPFLYFIVKKTANVIMFAGILNDPTQP